MEFIQSELTLLSYFHAIFHYCISLNICVRLVLNGEVVDFEPIVNSRLRHHPLTKGRRLQLGCKPEDDEDCSCENGGVCEDGECNCLETAFTGDQCQIRKLSTLKNSVNLKTHLFTKRRLKTSSFLSFRNTQTERIGN